jgi:protein-S-isoprenylcysteine O-methyltransferase Ste14
MRLLRRLTVAEVLVLWTVGLILVHGVAPLLISYFSARHGWYQSTPAAWNSTGLLLVAAGYSSLVFMLFMHLTEMTAPIAFNFTPTYLLRRGPYRFTRNPMYVAVVVLWSGWAMFYGSAAVSIACIVAFLTANYVIIPREERSLERRFGEEYRHYRTTVPRWISLGGRHAPPLNQINQKPKAARDSR